MSDLSAMSDTHPLAKGHRILLVEDEEDLRWILAGCLREQGFEVVEAGTADEARQHQTAHPAQVVVSDVRMPGESGVDLMAGLHEVDGRLPVILISALDDVQTAVEAMKLGAYDYLTKPFENERLIRIVQRALETQALHREVRRLRSRLGTNKVSFGVSPQAAQLQKQVELVASTPGLSVLLQGESGTGKEILARTIHESSPRRARPFVAVDCGALPQPLLESLVFGHKKGSFTGADRDRDGFFLEADGGTLFLDELGNLPLRLQSKLLRSLQEREVLPLGSDRPVPFDVRLLAATNRDLLQDTSTGGFRLDLYHRIAEFVLHLPPLRERPQDIPHFAAHFLDQIAAELGRGPLRLSTEAQRRLARHRWPGNLRELLNCLRRAALLAGESQISAEHLDLSRPDAPAASEPPAFHEGVPLKEQLQRAASELEKSWIRAVLQQADGNKAEAARRLGIDYTTLHRKLKRYGLDTMAELP